jgi:hypothetical protein
MNAFRRLSVHKAKQAMAQKQGKDIHQHLKRPAPKSLCIFAKTAVCNGPDSHLGEWLPPPHRLPTPL